MSARSIPRVSPRNSVKNDKVCEDKKELVAGAGFEPTTFRL